MQLNLHLFAGPHTGPNGCRVLLNALDAYADEIRQTGFAEDEGDAAPVLQQLFRLTHDIATAFLDLAEGLDTGSEPDGQGGYRLVYREISPSPLTSAGRESLTR